jgi:hypothetical protein
VSTKRREYEYGRIISVDIVPLGDNLAADVSAGATSITVEDACDFDEDGGQLLLNGVVYTYATWVEDETTGTGTLSGLDPVLAASATEGTVVAVYDPMYACAATDKVCQVELTGDDGNTDTLEASLALHLVGKLDEGVRGNNGEQVKLELEGDEWVIVDIFGLGDPDTGPGGEHYKIDPFTVAAPGAQSLALTYVPLPESHHLYWNGDEQQGAYTISGQTVVIDSTEGATLEVGDSLVAKYAYRMPAIAPAATFVPTQLSGMLIWYSAEAETAWADGAQMTSWTDRSGNGWHATGTYTTSTKPLWQATTGPSGGAAVRFQSDGVFSIDPAAFAPLTSGEVFVQIKADTQNSSKSWCDLRNTGDPSHYLGGGNWAEPFGSTVRKDILSFSPSVTVWRRMNIHTAPNDWEARLDEVAYGTTSSNSVGWNNGGVATIGDGYPPAGPFAGYMTTFLMYDRKLTADERAAVIAWMQANPSGGTP